nr:hypothetical protein CFP56_63425 [Quercus suber]
MFGRATARQGPSLLPVICISVITCSGYGRDLLLAPHHVHQDQATKGFVIKSRALAMSAGLAFQLRIKDMGEIARGIPPNGSSISNFESLA